MVTEKPQLNYSEQHNFVLWSLPRTGTRYVATTLRQFGLTSGVREDGRNHPPTHVIGLPRRRGCRVVCMVRNPFVRALSLWQWQCQLGRSKPQPQPSPTFSQWVRCFRDANEMGWMIASCGLVDGLGKSAELITWKIHLDKHREEIEALPFVNEQIKWAPNRYRSEYSRAAMDYYTPELLGRVTKLYEKDFEFGGYDPEADFEFESY